MIYYLLVVFGVFACSASQLLLKESATIEYKYAVYELLNWRVLVAYCIMFATLVANIYAMSKGVRLKDIPVLEALGYAFVPLFAYLMLGERISRKSMISIFLIISGVVIFYI